MGLWRLEAAHSDYPQSWAVFGRRGLRGETGAGTHWSLLIPGAQTRGEFSLRTKTTTKGRDDDDNQLRLNESSCYHTMFMLCLLPLLWVLLLEFWECLSKFEVVTGLKCQHSLSWGLRLTEAGGRGWGWCCRRDSQTRTGHSSSGSSHQPPTQTWVCSVPPRLGPAQVRGRSENSGLKLKQERARDSKNLITLSIILRRMINYRCLTQLINCKHSSQFSPPPFISPGSCGKWKHKN